MGDQDRELSCALMITELNKKKKIYSSFLIRIQLMKSLGLFNITSQLLFTIKEFSFPFFMGTCMRLATVADT